MVGLDGRLAWVALAPPLGTLAPIYGATIQPSSPPDAPSAGSLLTWDIHLVRKDIKQEYVQSCNGPETIALYKMMGKLS